MKNLSTDEIRSAFLDFFKNKKHTVIESDSLVPKEDPTVLFTTAGMQQFKRQFLGYTDEYTRAASSQKCLRTDDLDEVGKTNFHHTFFEMLGNFSFGDYFKEEAILWAWEFFTEVLEIPREKLWASVYKDDREAEEIWKKKVSGFDAKKLLKLGDHDNFWPADAKENGPNGPCGPCSEIFYDFGENAECKKKKCDPTCNCGRFSEVWNLVFTQFDRKEGGNLEPLPSKNIDTGMGLERLAAVLQGKTNNYDIDIFEPIFKAIDRHIDPNSRLDKHNRCLIADHIRAITFGIADGVVPSNEGRGYVIKKLINSLAETSILNGNNKPAIYKLVNSVAQAMGNPYPELKKQQKDIEETVEYTEKTYLKTRTDYLPKFKKEYDNANSSDEKAKILWTYYDTYGLGLPTMSTAAVVSKKETERFEIYKKEQQERSRASSKMTGDVFTNVAENLGVPKTKFIGYDMAHSTSTILKLLVDGKKVDQVKKGVKVQVFLDKTPFYAESGGQIGDTGVIVHDKSVMRISDTQKFEDIYIHSGEVKEGSFKVNDQIDATIDIERRQAIMRNHTATHLLQSALRSVLGEHVKQQGSLVAADRLRFDFTHPKAITQDQMVKIERDVNIRILANDQLTKEFLDIDEAKSSDALAFFAEKYGKVVRVVSIDNVSKEFCGGTHVDATGEIGLFKIISESAIAQGIRRIEAKTGLGALDYINEEETQLNTLADKMRCSKTELMPRIEQQSQRLKKMEKEIVQYKFEAIKGSLDNILKKADTQNGSKIITHSFKDVEMEILRKVSDLLKQKSKSAVITLGAQTSDSASLLISVSDDLIKKGIKANEIISEVAPIINGKGGGKPQLAQAGSKKASKINEALEAAKKLVKEKMNS